MLFRDFLVSFPKKWHPWHWQSAFFWTLIQSEECLRWVLSRYIRYILNDRSTVNSIFYIIESSHTSFVVLNIDGRSGYPNFKLARRSSNDTEEGVTEASSGSQFVKPWGSDLLTMFEVLVVDDNFLWKDNWSLYQFFLIMYVCLRKCARAVLAPWLLMCAEIWRSGCLIGLLAECACTGRWASNFYLAAIKHHRILCCRQCYLDRYCSGCEKDYEYGNLKDNQCSTCWQSQVLPAINFWSNTSSMTSIVYSL